MRLLLLLVEAEDGKSKDCAQFIINAVVVVVAVGLLLLLLLGKLLPNCVSFALAELAAEEALKQNGKWQRKIS